MGVTIRQKLCLLAAEIMNKSPVQIVLFFGFHAICSKMCCIRILEINVVFEVSNSAYSFVRFHFPQKVSLERMHPITVT